MGPDAGGAGAKAWRVVTSAAKKAAHDRAHRLAASLAYYTAFSLAPLLVLVIALVGLVFGVEAAKHEVLENVRGVIGAGGTQAVERLLQHVARPGPVAIAGFVILLVGTYGALATLRYALNVVWDESPDGRHDGAASFVKSVLRTVALIPVVALLVAVSFTAGAVASGLLRYAGALPEAAGAATRTALESLVAIVLVATFLAGAFKLLPDADPRWRHVWPGAILASLLLAAGRYLIGAYVARSALLEAYAAAGSMTLILVWSYFAALSTVIGAEVAEAVAKVYGARGEGERDRERKGERAARREGAG